MAQKHIVTGEQHYGITGQLLEIQRQLRMKAGSPIDPEHLRHILQGFIEPGYSYKKITSTDFLESIRASGYLDTSFDGKEVHRLLIRQLTKEEAFDEYRTSGGDTWVWNRLEKNIPYAILKVGILDVMFLGFGRSIGSDEGVAIMDNLGVRPLVFEEHIQLGILRPSYQEKNPLVALTKYTLVGNPHAPILRFDDDGRDLDAIHWGDEWDDGYRFPVVRK